MKISKYKILSSGTKDGLEQAVNRWIEMGWQPFGGVSVSEGWYYQALVMM